jgi:nucleotide-binding universal stress UspA family protein
MVRPSGLTWMRALVWIVEDTWEATVAEAAAFLPSGAEVTLLHVASAEPEAVARAARRGLLGRQPPPAPAREPLRAISEEAAEALLRDAEARLGRAARREARRGRVEREVVAAAEGADVLVLARDGDRERLGPRSLGPAARFVVDHAPCRVLLIWPDVAPSLATIPPPPAPGAVPPTAPGR